MLNIKRLSMIASLLLLIGILGSFSTYKFISELESLTEEIADDNFTDIEISANDGEIELVPTNEMKARIEVSGNHLKNNFSAAVTDSTLSITYKESAKKFYNFDFAKRSASIKLYIPKKTYNTLSVRANNGRLMVKEVEVSEMDLHTNNGSIDLKNIHTDLLSMNANNGRITLKNIATDSVSIVSHNGNIELEEVTGALLAKANNGSINLVTDTLDTPIDFSTHNGKIHIQTNLEPIDAEIQAQVKNGSTKIFGEKKSHTAFGSGKNKIDLSSNNGRIVVEKQ